MPSDNLFLTLFDMFQSSLFSSLPIVLICIDLSFVLCFSPAVFLCFLRLWLNGVYQVPTIYHEAIQHVCAIFLRTIERPLAYHEQTSKGQRSCRLALD